MAPSTLSGPPVFHEERVTDKLSLMVGGVTMSPNGTMMACVGGLHSSMTLVEIASGRKIYTFNPDDSVRSIVWSTDETRFWVFAFDGPSIYEVLRAAGGYKWSHARVYTHSNYVAATTYVSAYGLLALACSSKRLTLVDVAAKYKTVQSMPLPASPRHFICNTSGSLLLVACCDGSLHAFTRNDNGAYSKVMERPPQSHDLCSLVLSPSGSLLFLGSLDRSASLWRVSSPFLSFDASPLWRLKKQPRDCCGAAFSGDEQFVLTVVEESTIRIGRVADGTEVGSIPFKHHVYGISFHAASGMLAVATGIGGAAVFRCAPYEHAPPSTDDILFDRRARRSFAARDLAVVKERLALLDASVHAACHKERGLLADMDRVKNQLALMEKDLASLRTADFIKQRDKLVKLLEQERALESEISSHDHVLRELEDNTKSINCLGYLHGDVFEQWLRDVGLGHAHSQLKEVNGTLLGTMLVADLEAYGLSFADSCALLLRANITQHQLSAAPHFAPPPGLLSWDAKTTSTWLRGHGGEYAAISSLGWTGACLCSLGAPRVRGLLGPDSFAQLRRIVRDQLASEGAPEWAQSWTGLALIDR